MRLLIIAMLLLSAPAMACDSYEECIKSAQDAMPSNHSIEEHGTADMAYLRAIAYKLDEISQRIKAQEHVHQFSLWSYGNRNDSCRRVCITCDMTEQKWEPGSIADWCRN